jgi:glycosyltransferase involved in cell wall biosynthesis
VNIGLNLLYVLPGLVGGTETYAHGLLHGFAQLPDDNRYTVFLNEESRDWLEPVDARFRPVVCPVHAASRRARYTFEQFRLPALTRTGRVDLLHSLGYVAPLRCPVPSVVTVHDLNYRNFGRTMPLLRRTALSFFVSRAVKRAACVITDAEFGRQEVARTLGKSLDRVVAIPLAPKIRPPSAARATADVPYLLAFSSESPNKNLARLLAAWNEARTRHPITHELRLIGHRPAGLPSDQGSCVRWTGWIDDAAVGAQLAGADGLVFPSYYEGFGLPVLEAMEAGVAVAASRAASIPEVAGEAALFFDPFDLHDMATAIARLATDPALRAALVKRGHQQASRFSWQRSARMTLEVYSSVLSASHGRGARRV